MRKVSLAAVIFIWPPSTFPGSPLHHDGLLVLAFCSRNNRREKSAPKCLANSHIEKSACLCTSSPPSRCVQHHQSCFLFSRSCTRKKMEAKMREKKINARGPVSVLWVTSHHRSADVAQGGGQAFPPSSYLIFFHSTKANQCWNNGRRLRLTQPCCDFVSAVRNFPSPAPPVIFPPQPPAPPLKSAVRKVQKAERAAEKCALAFPNESH